MSLEVDDILHACHEVMVLGRKADLTFKALPAIQWEFADPGEFLRAERELMASLHAHDSFINGTAAVRGSHAEGVIEVDAFGVTFRLLYRGALERGR